MIKVTFAILLAALMPAPSFAIEVPLVDGQSLAEVFDALKDALGIEHRYVDPDSNVMRLWNVKDDVAFVLPEGATPAGLARLLLSIQTIRVGDPVPDPRSPGAKPRRVDFGTTTVRVVDPKTVAEHPWAVRDHLKFLRPDPDALPRGLPAGWPARLTPKQQKRLMANAYGILPGDDAATVRGKIEAKLKQLAPSLPAASIDRTVDRYWEVIEAAATPRPCGAAFDDTKG